MHVGIIIKRVRLLVWQPIRLFSSMQVRIIVYWKSVRQLALTDWKKTFLCLGSQTQQDPNKIFLSPELQSLKLNHQSIQGHELLLRPYRSKVIAPVGISCLAHARYHHSYSFICQYAPVIISSFSLQTLRSNSISIVDRESRVYISTGMSSLSLNLTLYGKIIVSNGYCTWEKNRVYLRRRRQPVSSHHSPHSTHCSTIGTEER